MGMTLVYASKEMLDCGIPAKAISELYHIRLEYIEALFNGEEIWLKDDYQADVLYKRGLVDGEAYNENIEQEIPAYEINYCECMSSVFYGFAEQLAGICTPWIRNNIEVVPGYMKKLIEMIRKE
ncbi:MAG: hypothetical protein KAS32_15910 [Candidatus Peribacteraceae bacterium]|nr:hypothetical protein [Candidatus Peribacteraceae bacterium]